MSINLRWDEIFKARPWGMEPASGVILLFALRYYFSDRPNLKVLDLGCGTGANLWYLACEGYQVYGIDGAPEAIEQTRYNIGQVCPDWKGELVVGDMVSLPWGDNTFDVVIDINAATCNTLDEMRRIYGEAYRVLKPGGMLHSQIFATGTETCCLQPGTDATFVSSGDLMSLYGEFGTPLIEGRSRPFHDKENAVCEWMVTASKTEPKWKHRA